MARKIDFDTVLKIGLALPGVESSTLYGVTGLKVHGKLLACPAINKSAEPNSLMIRIDNDQRDALIAEDPDTYYITDHYAGGAAVLVRLSRVNAAQLRDLLSAAWRFVTKTGKTQRGGVEGGGVRRKSSALAQHHRGAGGERLGQHPGILDGGFVADRRSRRVCNVPKKGSS
jgi:hypothetical protein